MSTINRKKLIQESQLVGQRTGNLNVLLTNAMAQRVGLSATEYECYELLRYNGPATAGKLAILCGISSGGMTGLIDRLEKLGFVERTTDPTDRRKVVVKAKNNRTAQAQLQKLSQPMIEAFSQLNKKYNDEQLVFLLDHSKRVNDIMEAILSSLAKK